MNAREYLALITTLPKKPDDVVIQRTALNVFSELNDEDKTTILLQAATVPSESDNINAQELIRLKVWFIKVVVIAVLVGVLLLTALFVGTSSSEDLKLFLESINSFSEATKTVLKGE